jgi:hypothetical protein
MTPAVKNVQMANEGKMMKITRLAMSAAIVLPALCGAAQAGPFCPEGRTFSGECVNVGLAQSMRKQAIAFSLPKMSYTAPPQLPQDDGEYVILRDYNELRRLFGVGPWSTCPSGAAFAC